MRYVFILNITTERQIILVDMFVKGMSKKKTVGFDILTLCLRNESSCELLKVTCQKYKFPCSIVSCSMYKAKCINCNSMLNNCQSSFQLKGRAEFSFFQLLLFMTFTLLALVSLFTIVQHDHHLTQALCISLALVCFHLEYSNANMLCFNWAENLYLGT